MLLLLFGEFVERVASTAGQLFEECRLYDFLHVLFDSGLGMTLQSRVNGGINAQTVLVDIVVLAVAFLVATAPVFHIVANIFPEIGRRAVVVANGTVVRHVDFFLLEFLEFLVAKVFLACSGVIVTVHLSHDGVAAA